MKKMNKRQKETEEVKARKVDGQSRVNEISHHSELANVLQDHIEAATAELPWKNELCEVREGDDRNRKKQKEE